VGEEDTLIESVGGVGVKVTHGRRVEEASLMFIKYSGSVESPRRFQIQAH
jgi:hypothetical protein